MSVRQRQLTQAGSEQVEAAEPGTPVASIDETPRAIADILTEWRAAERRIAAAEPGSAEEAEASALADPVAAGFRGCVRPAHAAREIGRSGCSAKRRDCPAESG